MPQSMWKPAALAVALALVLSAGAVRAQDYETEHPYILVNPKQPHPILNLLHVQPPLTCWSSHNNYSCGSTLSEGVFVFGSCRQFFGDPCLKGPPPPPWSPEANYPPDVNDPHGKRHCPSCGDY